MAFKISGFAAFQKEEKETTPIYESYSQVTVPRKSLVQVRFSGRSLALTYYNDRFDLKVGDRVYVDGKLEGILGRVTGISYNFKIKSSDYQRVIAVLETNVRGQFYMAGTHFVTFDTNALPVEKAKSWFKAPEKEDDEYVSNTDDSSFWLSDLKGMKISSTIAERGHQYYLENRVRYLCLDGTKGFAIVEGSENYTVEFRYKNGEISHLICDCPCACTCKHEFATMLQLRETLELIEQRYKGEYGNFDYFAAIAKSDLFFFAIDGRETGSFTL